MAIATIPLAVPASATIRFLEIRMLFHSLFSLDHVETCGRHFSGRAYPLATPESAVNGPSRSNLLLVNPVDAVDLALDRLGDGDHRPVILEDPADLAPRHAVTA